MIKSRVSIGIIAKSHENLTATLDSLLAQTYDDTTITVLHDLADINIHGIIRHYKKIILSIDINDSTAIDNVISYGRYYCTLNCGDIVSASWVKDTVDQITKTESSVLLHLPAILNAEGNIIEEQQIPINKYALLVDLYLQTSESKTIPFVDTSKKEHSIKSLHISEDPIIGTRELVATNNTLLNSYINNVVYEDPERLLQNMNEQQKALKTAQLIKRYAIQGHILSSIKMFFYAMSSSGYRRDTVRYLIQRGTV